MDEDKQILMHQQKIADVDMDKDMDEDKIERDLIMTPMQGSQDLRFTIYLKPGTSMHIKITPEDRLPKGNWRISTLLVHNGSHYIHTIHNYTAHPDVLRNLGLIHEPNTINLSQMCPQILMPLDVPRNPLITIARILSDVGIQPVEITKMVDCFYNYMIDMARQFDKMIQPKFDDADNLPILMNNTQPTNPSLESVLGNLMVCNEVPKAPNIPKFPKIKDVDSDGDDKDDCLNGADADADADDDGYVAAFECAADDLDDSDSDSSVLVDNFDDSQGKRDDDETPTASEPCNQVDDTLRYEIYPENDWSITSSEGSNDYLEDDSWGSESGDSASFDDHTMTNLRNHANGLINRLNAEWVNATNFPAPPPECDWDANSCNSMGDIDDLWSEISASSYDNGFWHYNEDRSFETALSRPLRRLIGEIPAETAQQERQAWLEIAELCDFRPENASFSPVPYGMEPQFQPLTSSGHCLPQENSVTTSNNIHSGCPFNSGSPNGNSMNSFCYHSNVNEFFNPELARLRHSLEHSDSDLEPEIEIHSKKNMYAKKLNEDIGIAIDQNIVPLALYLKQTDDLIAQITANL